MGLVDPVVAGVITADVGKYVFTYGQSYLRRTNAIALFEPELPLVAGPQVPVFGMASCLRDGAPDAWGRRVIINRLSGEKGSALDTINLDELTFLLESGLDRIGGLDFQRSAQDYQPRAITPLFGMGDNCILRLPTYLPSGARRTGGYPGYVNYRAESF